ncbi:unnamed protein product [Calypogeia fissa]
MVMRKLAVEASSFVNNFGFSFVMSIPSSLMATTHSGCTRSPGCVPAEIPLAWLGSASKLNMVLAIWDLPALWTQANRTVCTISDYLLNTRNSGVWVTCFLPRRFTLSTHQSGWLPTHHNVPELSGRG